MTPKSSGTYVITNTVTGMQYFGSTTNHALRERQHWSSLRRGKHDNPRLQHSWNKHGESAFTFATLEEMPDHEVTRVRDKEQMLLTYNRITNRETFNLSITACGGNVYGGHSEETRRKISERAKVSQVGRKHPDDVRRKIAAAIAGVPKSDQQRKNNWAAQRKRVIVGLVTPDGETLPPFEGLAAFCRARGLYRPFIRDLIDGKRDNYKGWTMLRENDHEASA